MKNRVALSIDPGTRKCGVAVVRDGAPPETFHREVVATGDLAASCRTMLSRFPIDILLIGDATNSEAVREAVHSLCPASIPIRLVPEAYTSERARARWCLDTPPRNLWERLMPGCRTPPCPVDDYAAVILAEQFFAAGES